MGASFAEPTEDVWSALLDRQRDLEDAGTAQGAARFRRHLEQAERVGAASTVGGARQLLKEGLGALEVSLQAAIDNPTGHTCARPRKTKGAQPKGRHKGNVPVSREWTMLVGADVSAYLILKAALDATASGQAVPLLEIATSISDMMMDELRYRRFKALAPHLFEYKLRAAKRNQSTHPGHLRRSMNASLRFADIDCTDLVLSQTERMRVGLQLLDTLTTTLPWWSLVRPAEHKGKRAPAMKLQLLPDVRQKIEATNELLALTRPILGPMVVPPLPWAPGQRGGYRYGLAYRFPLVTKSRHGHEEFIAAARMPKVYAAVNAMQETPYRINGRVLAVVEEIMDLGGGFAGLPPSHDSPLPDKPADIATNAEAKAAWKAVAREVYRSNHLRRIDAGKVSRVLGVAQEVQDEDAIYFPHHLDFRGRVYPVATYLTPQGDDLSRALLTFADSKPVDAPARRWLAIHGANTLGILPDGRKVSELSLDARVEAIDALTATLVEVAADPIGKAGSWIGAEKPLQFLAFCFEWASLVNAEARGEVYASSLPVSMDGSCNGLQHLSALLLDASGGAAVNLTPSTEPQDIYRLVAEAVVKRMATLAAGGDAIAAAWIALHHETGILDRKFTKRPTMTFGYGSKRFGFRTQLIAQMEALPDADALALRFATGDTPAWQARAAACTLLAQVIWDALEEIAVAASGAMTWMTKVAQGIAKQNLPVEWVAPSGFPVRQPYRSRKQVQTATILCGQVVAPVAYTDAPKIDRKKQAAGLAPNLTHSLDASHLVMVVDAALAADVTHFQMIHDSFGTHSADAATLARILREEFVTLYRRDVAGNLFTQFKAQWPKCPAPPAKGSLDLNGVLLADYFFC